MPPKVPAEPERRQISETVLDGNTTLPHEASETEIIFEEIFMEIQPQLLLFLQEIQKSGVNNQQDLSLYLNSRRLDLLKLPIIDEHFFRTALTSVDVETEKSFCLVETDKIVGRPFAKEYEDGWSHEYESRKGRIVEIAGEFVRGVQNLLQDATRENAALIGQLERVFHLNEPAERIKVLALDGPSGPIYLVEDGTHRVAAAKLINLKAIPCEVTKIKYPLTQWTYDEEVARFW